MTQEVLQWKYGSYPAFRLGRPNVSLASGAASAGGLELPQWADLCRSRAMLEGRCPKGRRVNHAELALLHVPHQVTRAVGHAGAARLQRTAERDGIGGED